MSPDHVGGADKKVSATPTAADRARQDWDRVNKIVQVWRGYMIEGDNAEGLERHIFKLIAEVRAEERGRAALLADTERAALDRAAEPLLTACRAAMAKASDAGYRLARFNAEGEAPAPAITAELAIREATEILRAAIRARGLAAAAPTTEDRT